MRHFHIRILAGRLDTTAGSHVYHDQIIRRLAGRGHHVSVVCYGDGGRVRDVAEVHEIALRPYHRGRVVWRFATLRQYWHCTRAVSRLPLSRADVVIGGEHLFLRGHHRRFPETPWLYLPHSLTVEREIASYQLPKGMHYVTNRVYTSLQLWALDQADRTVRFTDAGCRALLDQYGGRVRPRFVVNPVGIDIPPRADKPRGSLVRLLSVGSLNYGKRIDFALQVLSRLRDRPWRYDVVGDGPHRRALVEKSQQLGIGDRVVFHGHQTSPGAYYDNAHLLLFPSRSESLGLVVLEAMSHGVPCLGFRSDGVVSSNVNEEIIEAGRTGFLASDEAGFESELDRILREPGMLDSIGQAAREEVRKRNDWEAHLLRYEQVFEEVLSGQDRSGVTERQSSRFPCP